MPVRRFQLLAFEDIMLLRGDLLEEGSLFWLLCQYSDLLFPDWLFDGWRGESVRGRPAWPAPVLMGLQLLRYSEIGMSRAESLRRAGNDARWRAALRLPWSVQPPDDHTVRDGCDRCLLVLPHKLTNATYHPIVPPADRATSPAHPGDPCGARAAVRHACEQGHVAG